MFFYPISYSHLMSLVSDCQVPALEALVGWFAVKEHRANWCQRLEQLLLKGPDFFMRLLNIFKCQDAGTDEWTFCWEKSLNGLMNPD